MSVRILQGDCRSVLLELAPESVNCIVTSPPYWGLRDYGVDGQSGLEATPEEYVTGMVEVFRQARRVLRDDGTLWLNVGDTYAANRGYQVADSKWVDVGNTRGMKATDMGLKPKDLVGIPWMLAFALRADGWYLRRRIVWCKPNGMPESVEDRPTAATEDVFLLSKSEHYHYDAKAIRMPPAASSITRWSQYLEAQEGSARANGGGETNGNMKAAGAGARALGGAPHGRHALGENVPPNERRSDKQRGHSRKHAGFNDRWDAMSVAEQQSMGSNLRDWWIIPTEGFADAHFAVMPTALARICILAGCPEGGTVLDPFGGAGTTGLVADRHGRNAVLIELNQEYAAIAEKRIRGDAPLFAEVSA